GCHAAINFSTSAQSGCPFCASKRGNGVAERVKAWPTATPIRRKPKSNAKKIPVVDGLRMPRLMRNRENIYTDQTCRGLPSVFSRRTKKNDGAIRCNEPIIALQFDFQLPGLPAGIAQGH